MSVRYNFDVEAPAFDSNGIARTNGFVKVYGIDPTTREYTSARYEYVVATTGIPAGCYLDSPKQPPIGYAVRRKEDGSEWEFVVDHRKKISYKKSDQSQYVIDYLGEVKPDYTLVAPTSSFDEWVDGAWRTNLIKQQEQQVREASNKRLYLQEIAEKHIDHIKSAIAANDATPEELESLAPWEAYNRALARLDVSKAPNIEWPENQAKFRLPGV